MSDDIFCDGCGCRLESDGIIINFCPNQQCSRFLNHKRHGASLDPKGVAGKLKPQLQLIPPVLLVETAKAYSQGAKDYGAWNWRMNKVEYMTYLGAMKRHIDQVIDRVDEDDIDTKSLCHHLGAVAASCGIVLDAQQQGTLVDNRPPNNRKKPFQSTDEPAECIAHQLAKGNILTKNGWVSEKEFLEKTANLTSQSTDGTVVYKQLNPKPKCGIMDNHVIDGTGVCPRCQAVI